jgi:hypothetical protein
MIRVVKVILIIFIILATIWFILWFFGRKKFPVEYGISFNQNHAQSLGLEWKDVYTDMLSELKPEYVRIAAMWSQVEPEHGVFDFADVDFMMDQAKKYDTRVQLVVGQKAPRWPECHVPGWIDGYGKDDAKKDLLTYVETVIKMYKDHPALDLWQVENEAFISFQFGECDRFDRDVVFEELDLVRTLDPGHQIVMTDSGELSTWRKPSRLGDKFGTTLYRIVQTPKGHTFTYDWLPSGFYRLKAKLWGIAYEDFFVAELQAEPWFTDSSPLDATVEEQEKTMNPERLQKHLDYAERVGASRVHLWGVEWWYYMKQERGDERYWDIVKDVIKGNE